MTHSAAQLPEIANAVPPLDDELTQDPAIRGVLENVHAHFGLEIVFVSRYVEAEQRELTHLSSDLDLPIAPGFREQRESSFCWHVLNNRLPQLIDDRADYPATDRLGMTELFPIGSHLNTPLRLEDGAVWGSLCAMGRKPDHTLNARDLQLFKSFASIVAERIDAILDDRSGDSEARRRVENILDGHAISIFQQPIHDLTTCRPAGVECLARFPDLKKRGPDAWFDDAERVGLGKEIEMTAVRVALETLGGMPDGIFAAINASPKTILSGDLRRVLEDIGPINLVIEVGEHENVGDFAAFVREIRALKPFAKIAIDDVSAGYDGLRNIVDLQPDILKMDMILTRGIETDAARRAITAAMTGFAHEIGAKIVAEGIESEAEFVAMRELGVDYGQGYLISRPLPVVAARHYLLGEMGD